MDQDDYVVIVDDDPDDLLLANVALQQCGCPLPIRLVSSGSELIHLLTAKHPETGDRTAPPRLILLDLRMPGFSGLRIIERLSEDPHLQHVPVVAMSGSLDHRDQSGALSAGARMYVSKNLPNDAFQSALRDALSKCLSGSTSVRINRA